MKIVHIAPNAPYNDNWGYQENLLTKYQKKLGHDVTLIITNTTHRDGKIVQTDCADYMTQDGIRVVRLKRKQYIHRSLTAMCAHMQVLPLLEEIRPDFVFYHGLLGTTIDEVIRYKKHINPDCVIVQDNHLDYNIGTRCQSLKEKLVRCFHRWVNRRSIKYVSKVYGVTPWRSTYAQDYFRIPAEKTDVLIMGADDEKIDLRNRSAIRMAMRQKYNIKDDEFLIVTGGKIDKKKKIHLLMEACRGLANVKLLVFGQVSEDLQELLDQYLNENGNIIYVGWINADAVYDYFFAADLAFFPGQHSVLWEQACAAKVPCVFEAWEGMDHVNNGGNSAFLSPVTTDSIRDMIEKLHFSEEYDHMKQIAESEATNIYLYSVIAKKSLGCVSK